MKTRLKPSRGTGFALVSAIFLLVVLSSLGAFLVSVAGVHHASSALDIQGARAYQAARAGIEWAAYQVMDPTGTTPNPDPCPASPTAITPSGNLAGFSVAVTCNRSLHTEGGIGFALYQIASTASAGMPGSSDYIERRIDATLGK